MGKQPTTYLPVTGDDHSDTLAYMIRWAGVAIGSGSPFKVELDPDVSLIRMSYDGAEIYIRIFPDGNFSCIARTNFHLDCILGIEVNPRQDLTASLGDIIMKYFHIIDDRTEDTAGAYAYLEEQKEAYRNFTDGTSRFHADMKHVKKHQRSWKLQGCVMTGLIWLLRLSLFGLAAAYLICQYFL